MRTKEQIYTDLKKEWLAEAMKNSAQYTEKIMQEILVNVKNPLTDRGDYLTRMTIELIMALKHQYGLDRQYEERDLKIVLIIRHTLSLIPKVEAQFNRQFTITDQKNV